MAKAIDPSILPLLLWVVPVLICAVLLLFWKPRRIACPPSCGRCGYDVSKRDEDSVRCSECGADLYRPHGIITVRRARRRWASFLLIIFLLACAGRVTHLALPFPWDTWYLANAPTAWIAHHAEGKQSAWSGRAFDQWFFRYENHRLDSLQESRFHDYLLAWQADLSRRWNESMGDVLHKALTSRKLSQQQAERLLRGTITNVQFVTRSKIRVGDPVPVQWSATYRNGRYEQFELLKGCFVAFDTHASASPETSTGWSWGTPPQARGFRVIGAEIAGTHRLRPGTHQLNALLVLRIIDGSPELPLTPPVEHRATLKVEVLPHDTPLGTPIYDTSVTDTVAKSISVGLYRWAEQRIFARIEVLSAPVDRAFDVYAEHGGQRHFICRRQAKAGAAASGYNDVEYVPIIGSPNLKSLSLIFIGTGDALVESIDQQRYWAGTIIFPDVPLRPEMEAYNGLQEPRPYTVSPSTRP